MKSYRPFALPVAAAIKKSSEPLIGKRCATTDGWEVIEQLAVAPYDELNQWFYFNFFLETRNTEGALDFYRHDAYDVIVILRRQYSDGSCEYSYQTLDAYLKDHRSQAGTAMYPGDFPIA